MITTKKIKSKTRKYSRIIQRGGLPKRTKPTHQTLHRSLPPRYPQQISEHMWSSHPTKTGPPKSTLRRGLRTAAAVGLVALAPAAAAISIAAMPVYAGYRFSKSAGKYIVQKGKDLGQRIQKLRADREAKREAKRDAIARAVAEVQTAPVV
jgi:hypothetical protein